MTSIEQTVNATGIKIKAYCDPTKSNLGLEKYDQAIFPGVCHKEQLSLYENNGVKRYITGLNEFAPDVKLISDPEKREAKIKEIRTVVAQLEKELASNILNIEDADFWNKVVLLKPNNEDFWGKIEIECRNEDVILDIKKNPFDLIKYYAIEAGGFDMISKSYDEIKSSPNPPKFYLEKDISTISSKLEITKLKNKALAELEKLYNKHQNKLFYVCKVVDGNSVQYKKSTPNDIMYNNMDNFINGKGVESNIRRAVTAFNDAANSDMELLKIRSLIKDATFYHILKTKSDGFICHMKSGALLGRNVSDCIEFLKNPLNDAVLADVTKAVEEYWNI